MGLYYVDSKGKSQVEKPPNVESFYPIGWSYKTRNWNWKLKREHERERYFVLVCSHDDRYNPPVRVKRIEYYEKRDHDDVNDLLLPKEYKGYFSKVKDDSNHSFRQKTETSVGGPMPKVRFPLSTEST